MANRRAFLDTQGLFAWSSRDDATHQRAVEIIAGTKIPFVTTDWIIGETCNLFVARRQPQLVSRLFRLLDATSAIEMIWIGEDRFHLARELFEKFSEHAFPFTDCTSFVVMREMSIKDAVTSDRHFRIMGFNPLLAEVP